MIRTKIIASAALLAVLAVGLTSTSAAPKKAAAPEAQLSETGKQLEAKYAAMLAALKADITKALPAVDGQKQAALQAAADKTKRATAEADAAQQALGKLGSAKGLVDHAKGKWIGGADKGIAQAQADLKKATTDAQREAAKKDLAKWQANREDGMKALAERQAAYDQLKNEEPKLKQANDAAQAALTQARAEEMNAVKAVLAEVEPVCGSDKLDAKLVKAALLTAATPRGLAEFAQQGAAQAAQVEKLLADEKLMREMLIAGGAKFGKYGQAMAIYAAIQKASAKAGEGLFQRLALATSLEHAVPVKQSNPASQTNGPAIVDPVNRYLHYEKAYLAGELDPAFKDFTTWEYRMVVDCEAPDEILAWGREMLRTYRPDHISNPDYGWRYVSAVRTEVPYGSQNVKYDEPALQQHQNIIMNGGVCGRRAFFGRFILQSFGIPTWGVTQKAHAALSHWTPKGWVVNLGAGFNASWWDKDEVSMSGTQFQRESQAREHTQDYLKVLRAQWVSRVLGEPAYNERKKVAGGFWSSLGNFQTLMLASKAASLGPLGQELAEANDREQKIESTTVSAGDQQVAVKNGAIIIPAVAHGKPTGKAAAMKSYSGGMQLHGLGGFKSTYTFEAPQAGKYALSARVATVQKGQQLLFATNTGNQPAELAVPYTKGMWEQTPPVELTLAKGQNVLNFELKEGSRGVTIKDFTLKPVK